MDSIEQILDKLQTVYDAAVGRLREDVIAYGRNREVPPRNSSRSSG